MQDKYNPRIVEQEARQHWTSRDAFRAVEDSARRKYYCLSMFPYPSGKLHMGHVRNYTIGDVLTRYHRMLGFNVMQPMGWDAFGLPAENAAMANGVPPARWTDENIAYMKQQLQSLGFAIDWDRELRTCAPEYYRWNQWLFLRMLEKGIAYRKTGVVNWDPVDQTVLANEQVIDGRGWRTGALVEKREIPMYYLRITAYADELLADLGQLPGWPERVRTMQANWIGRSEGVEVAFPYEHGDGALKVFTTRADTLMGATYCAVAAEHPLATRAAAENPKLAEFVEACKRGSVMEADMATMDKQGMPTGLFVIHPLSGEKLPVWVANYVLMGYGEGAVMAVPAHDERDFAFARKYALPIKEVIRADPRLVDPRQACTFSADSWHDWYADKEHGVCVNSGKYDGLPYREAVDAIAADLAARGLGEKKVQYRLRDWGISRQRYWGTPIPIIHCAACGSVPVPDDQLPVILPEDCVPDGSGNPLNKRPDFLDVPCPKCGGAARRETDTMDTFVDSSWYFLRFAGPDAEQSMVDSRAPYWLPVNQYIGGIEHAILHLLYSRFWTKVMRDLGLIGLGEPFANLLTQGMVLNHIFFRRPGKGGIVYFSPEEVVPQHDAAGRVIGGTSKVDRLPVEYGGIGTMSKSKQNGVDPQSLIEEYGADTARFFIIFTSPPEQTLEWSDAGVEGSHRFLRKLWTFAYHNARSPIREWKRRVREGFDFEPFPLDFAACHPNLAKVRREVHFNLKQATYDLERHQFNTVASAAMKILNAVATLPRINSGDVASSPQHAHLLDETMSILLRLLSPITPHIAHVLWGELRFDGDIIDASWPAIDPSALAQDEIELVLQVNGKLRGNIRVAKDADRAAIEKTALDDPVARRFTDGQRIKKVVIVPGRLVNVVV